MSLPIPAPPIPLTDLIRTPGYAARVMALIDQIHRAPDACALVELLHRATTALGADCGAYVHAIPEDDSRGAARTALRVLLACDPLWAYAYTRDRPLDSDPWFRYARGHFEPVLASDLSRRGSMTSHGLALAERSGCRSGLIVPTQCGGGIGRFGVLCLGSALDGNFEADGTHLFRVLAHSLSNELHGWWMNETRTHLMQASRLSRADLELLALERQGLVTKQIARTLGVSAAAVNSRFQRINVKLTSPNRRVSAMRAAAHGLL